jgi:hypothetical protein
MEARFLELTRMKYVDQAKWFLNGFWKEGAEQEAETIWKCTQKFIELDDKKKKEGKEVLTRSELEILLLVVILMQYYTKCSKHS